MHSIKSQFAIGLVCLVLGFAVTLQLRSVSINYSGNNREVLRIEDLSMELSHQKDLNADLYEQILSLTSDLNMYRDESTKTSGAAKVLSEQLTRAEITAGLVALTGEGVVVTLDDSKQKTPGMTNREIIHDDDIRRIVSELYIAGAEAISINSERLIASSGIRCIGPVVMVNNTQLSPPYVIRAIGNPDTLDAALNIRDGVVDFMRNLWKQEVEVKKESNITIPRYNGVINYKYASPQKEGGT